MIQWVFPHRNFNKFWLPPHLTKLLIDLSRNKYLVDTLRSCLVDPLFCFVTHSLGHKYNKTDSPVCVPCIAWGQETGHHSHHTGWLPGRRVVHLSTSRTSTYTTVFSHKNTTLFNLHTTTNFFVFVKSMILRCLWTKMLVDCLKSTSFTLQNGSSLLTFYYFFWMPVCPVVLSEDDQF